VKRGVKRPQYAKCEDCGSRFMVVMAKKTVCASCHVAKQGMIRIEISALAERT
jgi:DNA-directed RNA polymerase subunit RPC12/RpoP